MHNKLSQNSALETVNIYYLTQFSRVRNSERRAQVSRKIAIQSSVRAAVTSRLDWGWSFRFQVHSCGCWQHSVPCWLLARSLSSLPPWPACVFSSHSWWIPPWDRDPGEREPIQKPQSFTTSSQKRHTFASPVLSWPHRPILTWCGRGLHEDMNSRGWVFLGAILEASKHINVQILPVAQAARSPTVILRKVIPLTIIIRPG